MKNAIILHGSGDSPESFWIPWLKSELEKHGYEVWAPLLPDADNPDINKWLPFVMENGKFNNDTIIIGHSAGATLIWALLDKIDVKIKQAVLVSGFVDYGILDSILKEDYNWDKISKGTSEKLIFINSENDPWGCDDKQGRKMLDLAGGIQIIIKGEGHMGSMRFNQSYKEFPLLKKLIID